MQGKLKYTPQLDMFKIQLKELVSKDHALIILGQKTDWNTLENDITFPTDAKLAVAILKECWRLADRCGIKLHQSYTRKTSQAKLKLRFGHNGTKFLERGIYGDFVNCVLAAACFNLRKLLRKTEASLDNIIRCFYWIYYCLLGKNNSMLKSGF